MAGFERPSRGRRPNRLGGKGIRSEAERTRQIVEAPSADNHLLSDEALLACGGGLLQESCYFQQPDHGHRSSPLFKATLRLHTIESARARYIAWCADVWDGHNVGRPRSGRIIDGQMVEDQAPANPFRTVDA